MAHFVPPAAIRINQKEKDVTIIVTVVIPTTTSNRETIKACASSL
jgi:hypothetical protein